MHCAESDIVRVFDDKLDLTDKEMQRYLKQADLESYGFEKTVETSTVTDEYGKKVTKKTIYYKVVVDCLNVKKWVRVLEQRLPGKLKTMDIFSKTVKEVQSRIAGRKTKRCAVILEVHPGQCRKKSKGKNVSKRAVRGCGWWSKCCGCRICSSASIVYGS